MRFLFSVLRATTQYRNPLTSSMKPSYNEKVIKIPLWKLLCYKNALLIKTDWERINSSSKRTGPAPQSNAAARLRETEIPGHQNPTRTHRGISAESSTAHQTLFPGCMSYSRSFCFHSDTPLRAPQPDPAEINSLLHIKLLNLQFTAAGVKVYSSFTAPNYY